MIQYEDLSKGERFFINRRRLNLNSIEYAKKYHTTRKNITAWEKGLEAKSCPMVALHPYLTDGERLLLARRRVFKSLTEMATKMKVSHVTMIKWESSIECPEGIEWWNEKSWPKSIEQYENL